MNAVGDRHFHDGERHGFLVAGHWIVDISKRIDHWPAPQTLALIDQVVSTNGGAAFNVACDLVRLAPGLPVAGVGLIGADAPGEFVVETCRKLGVDCAALERTGLAPTAFTDVMTERDSGRRTFFHLSGANALLAPAHIPVAGRNEKVFLLAYLGMLETLDRLEADGRNGASWVFESASRAGMLTAADLVSAPNDELFSQVVPCLPFLDVLFANEWEAGRLIGRPFAADTKPSASELLALAREIRALGLRGSVVLHCPEGAVSSGPEGDCIHGAVRMRDGEIAGTTGAGDAFAAGYLLALHENLDPGKKLELACCSAAVSLRAITCSDAILPWRECLRFGRERGFHSF